VEPDLKRAAGEFAAGLVHSGMVVGLGHGSTAIFATRRIAHLLEHGKLQDVVGVPCSLQTERDASTLGIPLTTLDEHPAVDLTIDGADEVDSHFNLIKGGGGALLREKIVAQASRREVIVVDEKKLSPQLGTHTAVPVEVIRFGWHAQVGWLESLGATVSPRKHASGRLFVTDQGNFILEANFGPIADPIWLAHALSERAGIVEHGLFMDIATDIVVASPSGVCHLRRET